MQKPVLFFFFFLPLFSGAQSPCNTSAHQQFDFWLGDWEVYQAKADTLVGRNTITKTLDGCVVEEYWRGAAGFEGKSFNTLQPDGETWEQTWVDQAGNTFRFTGSRQDNVMQFRGQGYTNKKEYEFEMSYTLLDEGEVRQLWKAREKGKEDWAVWFDGIYRRVKE
jgi:hypothetical protein